ncbi:MAG: iron-containing redox enzyme family protein [Myxococcales bacterium]|nr:iron-containing redox enzyme family protein [Myxococcales bacterium]
MTFDEHVRHVKTHTAWRDNPYFAELAAGRFERDDFVETQVQFLSAVAFFSRPMAVLAARLPRSALRQNLLRNVSEEHGHGDPSRTHEATFTELLGRLGVTPEDIAARALGPEVRAFNTMLIGLCTLDDPRTALAGMGIIEDLFAGISAFLGDQIARRGWMPREEIVHYATHEVLDVEHAEEFYELIRPRWDDAASRYAIEQGLALGAHAFLEMYRGLYVARGRRLRREVRGPHAAGDGLFP